MNQYIHPQMKQAVPASHWPVLISRRTEGRRLSWPAVGGY